MEQVPVGPGEVKREKNWLKPFLVVVLVLAVVKFGLLPSLGKLSLPLGGNSLGGIQAPPSETLPIITAVEGSVVAEWWGKPCTLGVPDIPIGDGSGSVMSCRICPLGVVWGIYSPSNVLLCS